MLSVLSWVLEGEGILCGWTLQLSCLQYSALHILDILVSLDLQLYWDIIHVKHNSTTESIVIISVSRLRSTIITVNFRAFSSPQGKPVLAVLPIRLPSHKQPLLCFLHLQVSYSGHFIWMSLYNMIFCNWLLSLSITFPSFIRVLTYVSTSFLFVVETDFCEYTFLSIHQSMDICLLFLPFGYYEWYCYKHLHAGFCEDIISSIFSSLF